jgi:3'(2'), 5'-bisphosphate nucleotidase
MIHADADALGVQLADIAAEAARLILPLWRSELVVHAKADESPVTEADRRAELLILERLEKAFPGVPVISEEHASEFGTPDEIGPQFFLVDPLDGTKAFVRGDPNFTVNIALVTDRVPVAGAVVAPPTGEIWRTAQGRVLKSAVDGSAGETEVRPRPWDAERAIALVSHTMSEERAVELAKQYGFAFREPMDSSIKFCRIAEGAADIYPRHGPTMEWDTAAGHAVLACAGGRVTSVDGSPFLYGKADEKFRNGFFVARGA